MSSVEGQQLHLNTVVDTWFTVVDGPRANFVRTIANVAFFVGNSAVRFAVLRVYDGASTYTVERLPISGFQVAAMLVGPRRVNLLTGDVLQAMVSGGVLSGQWSTSSFYADMQPSATYAEGTTRTIITDGLHNQIVSGPGVGFKRLVFSISGFNNTIAAHPAEVILGGPGPISRWIVRDFLPISSLRMWQWKRGPIVLLPEQFLTAVFNSGNNSDWVVGWTDVKD